MYEVVNSDEINFRIDFPLLCNARGVRIAVELGTDLGVFAQKFMERFNGEQLICVDNYEPYEWIDAPRTADMHFAIAALSKWHGRVRMVQMDTIRAAASMPGWLRNRVDFVYVDGDHRYEKVTADLAAWWDVLSDDGILAGHDYDASHPGVITAVIEFARARDLTVRLVSGDHLPSWYIYKREPAQLFHRFFLDTSSSNPRADD